MTHYHATNIAQTSHRLMADPGGEAPETDLRLTPVRPRRRLTRRIRAETHGASRESPPRLTAETHGVSRAVSRRLTRRESATTTRRVIIHCDTLLSGCYRCFDHYSIQVHSTTLCHDCPMIVACCTNACHCVAAVAAAVAIIK